MGVCGRYQGYSRTRTTDLVCKRNFTWWTRHTEFWVLGHSRETIRLDYRNKINNTIFIRRTVRCVQLNTLTGLRKVVLYIERTRKLQYSFCRWAEVIGIGVWGNSIHAILVTELLRPLFGAILLSAATFKNEFRLDLNSCKNFSCILNISGIYVDGYPLFLELTNVHVLKFFSSEFGGLALIPSP